MVGLIIEALKHTESQRIMRNKELACCILGQHVVCEMLDNLFALHVKVAQRIGIRSIGDATDRSKLDILSPVLWSTNTVYSFCHKPVTPLIDSLLLIDGLNFRRHMSKLLTPSMINCGTDDADIPKWSVDQTFAINLLLVPKLLVTSHVLSNQDADTS
jgi:hypothetical protein